MEAQPDPHIKLVAILGSARPGNYTSMALALVQKEIQRHPGVSLEVIDPATLDIAWPGLGITEDAKAIQAKVAAADGVILATPEYHGSFSSVMKLLIDNLGFPSSLRGKPISLLGVAGGRIGAIKALEHLRSVASHVGGLVLAGPISVANVRNVFDERGNVRDETAVAMIPRVATVLIEYIETRNCPQIALEGLARRVSA